jgi:hypothetical protein
LHVLELQEFGDSVARSGQKCGAGSKIYIGRAALILDPRGARRYHAWEFRGFISMRVWIRSALAALAALALAGCFVTTKPLITKANAAWPFAGDTAWKSYEWNDDTHEWKASGSGKILRVGDTYRMHPDPESGHEADPKDDMDFLLADLGDGYYAGQAVDNNAEHTIMLDVLKRDGSTFYQYLLMCAPEDKALADHGDIEKYEHGQYSDTCTVGSLDQLRKALNARLAANPQPHGKYVIGH